MTTFSTAVAGVLLAVSLFVFLTAFTALWWHIPAWRSALAVFALLCGLVAGMFGMASIVEARP